MTVISTYLKVPLRVSAVRSVSHNDLQSVFLTFYIALMFRIVGNSHIDGERSVAMWLMAAKNAIN